MPLRRTAQWKVITCEDWVVFRAPKQLSIQSNLQDGLYQAIDAMKAKTIESES